MAVGDEGRRRRRARRLFRWAPWFLTALAMLWLVPALAVDWQMDQSLALEPPALDWVLAWAHGGGPYESCCAWRPSLTALNVARHLTFLVLFSLTTAAVTAVLVGTVLLRPRLGLAHRKGHRAPRWVMALLPWGALAMIGLGTAGVLGVEVVYEYLRDIHAPVVLGGVLVACVATDTLRRTSLSDRDFMLRLGVQTIVLALIGRLGAALDGIWMWWLVGVGPSIVFTGWAAVFSWSGVLQRARMGRRRGALLPLAGLAVWLTTWTLCDAVSLHVAELIFSGDADEAMRLEADAAVAGWLDLGWALAAGLWAFSAARALKRTGTSVRGPWHAIAPMIGVLLLVWTPATVPNLPRESPSLEDAWTVVSGFDPLVRSESRERMSQSMGTSAEGRRTGLLMHDGGVVWLERAGKDGPELLVDRRTTMGTLLDALARLPPTETVALAWFGPERDAVPDAALRWPTVRSRYRGGRTRVITEVHDRASECRTEYGEVRCQVASAPRTRAFLADVDPRESVGHWLDARDDWDVAIEVDATSSRLHATHLDETGVRRRASDWNHRTVFFVLGGVVLGALLSRRRPATRAVALDGPYRSAVAVPRADGTNPRALRRLVLSAVNTVALAIACGVIGVIVGTVLLRP